MGTVILDKEHFEKFTKEVDNLINSTSFMSIELEKKENIIEAQKKQIIDLLKSQENQEIVDITPFLQKFREFGNVESRGIQNAQRG